MPPVDSPVNINASINLQGSLLYIEGYRTSHVFAHPTKLLSDPLDGISQLSTISLSEDPNGPPPPPVNTPLKCATGAATVINMPLELQNANSQQRFVDSLGSFGGLMNCFKPVFGSFNFFYSNRNE
jgi:hypothetical protein